MGSFWDDGGDHKAGWDCGLCKGGVKYGCKIISQVYVVVGSFEIIPDVGILVSCGDIHMVLSM